MSVDPLIRVDVSQLKTTEEKGEICKLFENAGWTFESFSSLGYDSEANHHIIGAYEFRWELIGKPQVVDLPSSCTVTRIH